jgi:ABC-type nickel/cobalt efflux system permease component RcnA
MTGTIALSACLWTAASVAFLHTLQGPDHYVPFIALARARGWSTLRTTLVTAACGVGHCASSVVLAFLGVGVLEVLDIDALQDARGRLAAWLLLGFGLFLTAVGVRGAWRGGRHRHVHAHADGSQHDHEHDHTGEHVHVHAAPDAGRRGRLLYWSLFIVFVLGPCEWLIPGSLAAWDRFGLAGMLATCVTFSTITVLTMLGVTLLALRGLSLKRWSRLERHATTLAGLSIVTAGLGMLVFDL